MRGFVLLFLSLLIYHLLPQLGFGQTFADHSVLSQGSWYKMAITKTGVYRLDYSFLKNAGLLKGTTDPRNIQLFGNVGGMLPQANNIKRVDDLMERAIYVEGEADGKFDNKDYLLFYANGPDLPHFDSATQQITVEHNVYSDTTYYFITVGSKIGKRIQQVPLANDGAEITTFNDYIHYEKDLINILSTDKIGAPQKGSGREWYGEGFDQPVLDQSFSLNMEGYVNGSPIHVYSSVLNCSYSSASFKLKLDNEEVGTHSVGATIDGLYNLKGISDERQWSYQPTTLSTPENAKLTYSYDKNGATEAIGFLNFFTINFERNLQLYGAQTFFGSFNSLQNSRSKFKIGNMKSKDFVWDVTNIYDPLSLQYDLNGNVAEFSCTTDTLREFVVFDGQSLSVPININPISNEDLHGAAPAQMLIITHNRLLSEAKRFADFRAQKSNISVQLATVQQIYNEFSSGRQDVTALRDFIRMVYLKGGKSLKYVLLFGDCSYDYKKNKVTNNDGSSTFDNTNLVPVYESRESLHPIKSYSSDDYFGFMEDNEGEWAEESNGDHTLDVAIGRITCKNIKEAKIAVDKIIKYSTDKNGLGNWRNNICFVADIGDENTHLKDADRLATKIDTTYKYLNTQKIYTAAYPLEFTDASNTLPISRKTKDAIDEAVKKGSLIVNYTGHGGVTGWSNEKILETTQINQWNNLEKLPLFVTATCIFGKYDDPTTTSAAELALLSPKGGAIALVTTTRPVFSSTNYVLNRAFYESIFTTVNGRMPTLGEAMVYTKNKSLNGTINRNFALLGDPSLTLAYPEYSVEVTEFNNKPIESGDTLKALSAITFKGEVKNEGELMNDFNGVVQLEVFDKPVTVSTLGYKDPVVQFSKRENVVFRGKATVRNGAFTSTFIVPKDIDYRFGEARINLYAYDAKNTRDAKGSISNLIIGGSSANYPLDSVAPTIKLYLNDSTFRSGDKVGRNNLLVALLTDESGINITHTSAGQDLKVLLIGNNKTTEIILNDYFEADLDRPNSGQVKFPLQNLEAGKYKLTLKAWDIYNNSNEAAIAFEVVDNKNISIQQLFNFPNPFNSAKGTTFSFSHDRPGDDVEVILNIYTVEGRLIKSFGNIIYQIEADNSDLSWDGKDDFGNKINTGIYIYQLQLRSLSDKNKSYRSSKLLFID